MAGLFGALGGLISPGLTAATEGAGGYLQGQQQGQDRATKSLMSTLELLRQQKEDEEKKTLQSAQIGNYNSEVSHRAAQDRAQAEGKPFYDSVRGVMIYPHGSADLAPQGGLPVAQTDALRTPTVRRLDLPPRPVTPRNIDPNSDAGIAAATKKAEGAAKAAATYGVEQTTGPEGTPVFSRRIDAPGQQAKTTTRVESATNTAAQARLEAAVSEMNNAHSNMSKYEARLANGTAKINAGAQVLGRVANAFTHDDPLSQLTQSGALSALNKTDPDLARYIRRGLSFAEGESMISQRPSDFRTKMAAFLSQAGSNASPEMIADIQGRRNSILTPLNGVVKPGGGGRGGRPSVPHGTSGGKTMSQKTFSALSPDEQAQAKADGWTIKP